MVAALAIAFENGPTSNGSWACVAIVHEGMILAKNAMQVR